MIALSSAVLIISIISIGDWGNLTTANVIYGLLAAALSLFLAVVLGFARNLNVHWDRAISVVLALMWVFAALLPLVPSSKPGMECSALGWALFAASRTS